MKAFKFIPALLLFILSSCSTVSVYSDFDIGADFGQYKTYAFLKSGIDKVEISDFDKKRILHAIEVEMDKKGFTKSENPDVLINFSTKEKERVDVSPFTIGFGMGWGRGMGRGGWGGPGIWGGQPMVSTSTEGTLVIDLIDAQKNELIWQGQGVGSLNPGAVDKDIQINEFVSKILAQYPPTKN